MKNSIRQHLTIKVNAEMRNAMTDLRTIKGWTYERIAEAFNLSPRGNGRAAQRLIDGTDYHHEAEALNNAFVLEEEVRLALCKLHKR